MLKVAVLVATAFFTNPLLAAEKHEHREHGAHVHGSAKMEIAFDEKVGKIEFHCPADSILGFEHKAQSAKDKKTQAEALKLLTDKMAEMVVFDSSLKCQMKAEKVEVDLEEGGHSDVDGDFAIHCEKSPVGTVMTFSVQKVFPKIKDLDVQVLVANIQKSIEVKKNGTTLELK